eukprot:scaffold1501_cov130-Cylindrotheca_fusiformis.AAC.10
MTSIYSYEQQKALFWTPKVPAIISIFCSGIIIYHILLDRKERLQKVYGRLWVGISATNIVVALFLMLGSLASPKETGIYGAFGNEASCTATAAVFAFIFVTCTGYNAALAAYYYISIRTRWTGKVFSKRVEPWLHIIPWCYSLCGVAVGLSYNMFAAHDMFLYGWAAPSPFGCRYEEDESCVEGNKQRATFVFMSGLMELNLLTLVKLCSTFALCYTVAKQEKKMQAKYHANKNRGSSIARETGIQSLIFLSCCLIPYGCMIILRIIDLYFWQARIVETAGFFGFSIFAQFMAPLQGMLNVICYFRPKIRERQRRVQGESLFHSFQVLLEMRPVNWSQFTAASTGTSSQFSKQLANWNDHGTNQERQETTATQGVSETETDLTEVNDDDDIAYMDVAVLEAACHHRCSLVLGEDMIGDVRDRYMKEKQRLRQETTN